MMLRVERDQMISAPAPDGPDQAFNMSVLPGRAEQWACPGCPWLARRPASPPANERASRQAPST